MILSSPWLKDQHAVMDVAQGNCTLRAGDVVFHLRYTPNPEAGEHAVECYAVFSCYEAVM